MYHTLLLERRLQCSSNEYMKQTEMLWQWMEASMNNTRTLELKKLNGIYPSFISLFTLCTGNIVISVIRNCYELHKKQQQSIF